MRRVSRRQFLSGGAVAVGAVASGSLDVASAFGAPRTGSDPKPIPGGFDDTFTPVPSNPLIHVLPPTPGFDMSTITDFNGVVAAGEVTGTANGGAFNFDCDMRVMRGVYAGVDNRLRQATFGFI